LGGTYWKGSRRSCSRGYRKNGPPRSVVGAGKTSWLWKKQLMEKEFRLKVVLGRGGRGATGCSGNRFRILHTPVLKRDSDQKKNEKKEDPSSQRSGKPLLQGEKGRIPKRTIKKNGWSDEIRAGRAKKHWDHLQSTGRKEHLKDSSEVGHKGGVKKSKFKRRTEIEPKKKKGRTTLTVLSREKAREPTPTRKRV